MTILENSQAVVLTAAASSSNGIQTVSSTVFDLFTEDFTLDCVVSRLPADTFTNFFYKFEDSSNLWRFSLNATNRLELAATVSSTSIISVTTINPVTLPTFGARLTAVVKRESFGNGKDGSVEFYFNGVLFETVVIPQKILATASNTGNLYLLGTNAVRHAGTIASAAIFNRALSAADVASLVIDGVAAADQWASVVKTFDFSADTDDFTGVDGTAAGNIDAIDSLDNNLRFTVDTGETTHYLKDVVNYAVGARYRVKGKYAIPSGQTVIDGIQFYQESDVALSPLLSVADGTFQDFDIELSDEITVADIRIHAMSGDQRVSVDAGGNDIFYIANGMTVEKLGCTQSLEPTGIDASLQWKDRSTNDFHAMLPEAGAVPLNAVNTWELRGSNVYAGAHAAQHVVGINQKCFPAGGGIWVEQYLMNIVGATPHDIIVGDGSDVDQWVAITTGIAAGKQALSVATGFDDGTNLKFILDPDTNATATYSSVISGRMLED